MMKASTYLTRLNRLLLLCGIVAVAAASVAAAQDGRPPDIRDAATASLAAAHDVSPPDVQDAAAALHTTPAGLNAYGERWEGIAQVYRDLELAGNGPTEQGVKADGLRWQGIAQVYQRQQSLEAPALRPDDRSGALGIGEPTSVSVSGASGFDWGDWSIGLAAGFGLAFALAGALIMTVRRVSRVSKSGAAVAG
jgi:hypothetical protein